MVLTGRTLPNSSNSSRRRTLDERKPVPTGVVSGLQRQPALADAGQRGGGQRIARAGDAGHAGLLHVPVERAAQGVQHLHGGFDDFRADAVSGYQGCGDTGRRSRVHGITLVVRPEQSSGHFTMATRRRGRVLPARRLAGRRAAVKSNLNVGCMETESQRGAASYSDCFRSFPECPFHVCYEHRRQPRPSSSRCRERFSPGGAVRPADRLARFLDGLERRRRF